MSTLPSVYCLLSSLFRLTQNVSLEQEKNLQLQKLLAQYHSRPPVTAAAADNAAATASTYIQNSVSLLPTGVMKGVSEVEGESPIIGHPLERRGTITLHKGRPTPGSQSTKTVACIEASVITPPVSVLWS